MGQLRTMGKFGDTNMMWNPDNADEVAAARRTFDDLRAKGHYAYRVKRKGEKGELITEFDPAAGKIIMAPRMAGG